MVLILVLVSNRDYMIIAYFFESLIDALLDIIAFSYKNSPNSFALI